MKYETKTFTDYDHFFRVYMARREAGIENTTPGHIVLDHPLSGASVRYNGKVYDVEMVYRQWMDFRWHVWLMMHDENKSSAMPIVAEWTRGNVVPVSDPLFRESAKRFWATAEMMINGEWTPVCELPFSL